MHSLEEIKLVIGWLVGCYHTMKLVCDLCHHQQPSLYCSSDSAFLCSDCDSQVHTANFLVARHIRVSICSYHHDSDCHDALSSSSSSSSSSSTVCNSISTFKTTSISDQKTREVLAGWCSRLGVNKGVIEVARHGFQVWWVNRSYHYRVGLAASLWLGFTKDKNNNNNNNNSSRTRMRSLLKRLEQISGVPAKSIVVEQLKLAAKLKHQQQQYQQEEEEEGWAES